MMSAVGLVNREALTIGGDRLRQAAEINESIKAIAEIARNIDMTALNAMLMARQAGSRSRGFAVVSVELRTFSRRLEGLMDELVKSISSSVIDIASLLRQFHMFRHLSLTAERSPAGKADVDALLAEKHGQLSASAGRIDIVWQRMHQEVGRALRFCQMGRSLAQSARVEAVYGETMSVALTHVAQQVGDAVDRMVELLARLHRHTEVHQ